MILSVFLVIFVFRGSFFLYHGGGGRFFLRGENTKDNVACSMRGFDSEVLSGCDICFQKETTFCISREREVGSIDHSERTLK